MTDTPYHDLAAPIEAAEEPPMKDEPVAWLHTLHMEHGQTITKINKADDTPGLQYGLNRPAFGTPGNDYSAEYRVTVQPLYTRPADDLVRQLVDALDLAAGRLATAACATPRPTRSDFVSWTADACKVREAARAQGYGG